MLFFFFFSAERAGKGEPERSIHLYFFLLRKFLASIGIESCPQFSIPEVSADPM